MAKQSLIISKEQHLLLWLSILKVEYFWEVSFLCYSTNKTFIFCSFITHKIFHSSHSFWFAVAAVPKHEWMKSCLEKQRRQCRAYWGSSAFQGVTLDQVCSNEGLLTFLIRPVLLAIILQYYLFYFFVKVFWFWNGWKHLNRLSSLFANSL